MVGFCLHQLNFLHVLCCIKLNLHVYNLISTKTPEGTTAELDLN
jgi:hypothetical protein